MNEFHVFINTSCLSESEMKESIVREVEAFLQRNSQASSTTSSQQKNYGQGLLQIPVSYDPSNEIPEVCIPYKPAVLYNVKCIISIICKVDILIFFSSGAYFTHSVTDPGGT